MNIAEKILGIESFVSVLVMIAVITLNPYSHAVLLHGVYITAFIAAALAQLIDALR
jgi:hypothetical protein